MITVGEHVGFESLGQVDEVTALVLMRDGTPVPGVILNAVDIGSKTAIGRSVTNENGIARIPVGNASVISIIPLTGSAFGKFFASIPREITVTRIPGGGLIPPFLNFTWVPIEEAEAAVAPEAAAAGVDPLPIILVAGAAVAAFVLLS